MYIALLVVMVNVRYPTKQYHPSGVRMRSLGISMGILLTAPSLVQTGVHMTIAEDSDPEPMEGVM